MKQIITYLLTISILLSLFSTSASAATGDLDLSSVRGSDLFEIDVDRESDCAFITSAMSTADRSFHHKYENDTLYSTTEFDILVVNYFENAYPVFRLWINYTADDFQYITSATFELDGKKYTFSGISDPDRLIETDDGIMESLLIKLGKDNLPFVLALTSLLAEVDNTDDLFEEIDSISIPLTLHGKEDIDIVLDGSFMLDHFLVASAYSSMDGLKYIDKVGSTTMKVH